MNFRYSYNRWLLLLGRVVNLRYINRWIIFCADLLVSLGVSLIGVLGLLSILRIHVESADVLRLGLASLIGSVFSFWAFKVYHGVIRYSTLRGVWRIGAVAVLKVLLMCLVLSCLGAGFSPSVYWVGCISDAALTIVMLIALRVFVINVYNSLLTQLGKKRKRILVFGTGEESVMIATSASQQVFLSNYSIIGFIRFGALKKSMRIAELPVYQIENLDDLYRLIPRNNLDGILFPNIKTAQQERDRLVRYCEQALLKTLVVPEMEEIRDGQMKRSIREVRIEDLLGREEIRINLTEIGNLLEGKTILVTGAAGSIGSEICRQLAHFPIKRLICFDAAETPMHNLRLELEERFERLDFVPVIGDVRSPERVDYVFRNWHPQVVFRQLPADHPIVARIDEPVARSHVLRDAHLGVDVVLEAVVIAVEVVGRNVRQNADMGAEPVHAVQLERAQFQDIPVVVARSHGVGEALADVAAEGHVVTRIAQDLVDERRRGGLAVRARDADALRTAHVAARELDLGDHRNARLADLPHDRRRVGNPRRLDDLRGGKDPLLGMAAFLVGDLPLVEFGLEPFGYLTGIGEKDPETLLFGEDRGAVAADAAAQYDDVFHVIGSST